MKQSRKIGMKIESMNRNPHVPERRSAIPARLDSRGLRETSPIIVAGLGLTPDVIVNLDCPQPCRPSEPSTEQGAYYTGCESSRESSGALATYLQTLSRIAELTGAEESEVARRAKLGDAAAREALIQVNLQSVVRIARRYVNLGLPLMDLIGEGNLGLMLAVDRYNPANDTRFIAYASFWIRRQIRLALSNQSRLIRLPLHRQNDLRTINAARGELHAALGREPTMEEIAAATVLPVATVRAVLGAIPKMVSLDATPSPDDTSALASCLPDENASDPAQLLLMRETVDLHGLDDAVNELKPRDREVIQARFGLAGGVTVTLVQLARRMNLTCEGVRQIQSRALRKLRRQMRMRRLATAVTGLRVRG